MKKKLIYLFVGLLVMSYAGTAQAWTEWNYTGGSHLWSNAANWSPHVPLSGEDPIMRGQGPGNNAVIDSSVTAVGRTMYIGYSGQADLDITGGSLTLGSGFRLGQSGTANVTVSGGAITISGDIILGDGAPGVATLTMSGGALNQVSGWFYVGFSGGTGTIHLDGGTITTNKVYMSTGHPLMDITGGKLIITNTDAVGVANELSGYMQAGQLTLFGGNPLATYSIIVNSSGYSELTAKIRTANVWNPGPANLSTGAGRNTNLSWFAGTTSQKTLTSLVDFKDDPCLVEFSGVATYRTEFNAPDLTHTLLSLGTVYGISQVTLNGKNLGHRLWGEYTYDATGALVIGKNVLEVKVTTTLSNFFRVWDNPVAKIWTQGNNGRPAVSEGMVGPVRLLKQTN
jgi:hypothetical protein